MTNSLPTRGQLERTLSQRIQALYRQHLGHRLQDVKCQIFDQKIVILIEQSITALEQLLANSGRAELVAEVHSNVDKAIEPHVKELIEAVVGVPVIDLLSDTTLATERTGIIAVLSDVPPMRNGNASNPA